MTGNHVTPLTAKTTPVTRDLWSFQVLLRPPQHFLGPNVTSCQYTPTSVLAR